MKHLRSVLTPVLTPVLTLVLSSATLLAHTNDLITQRTALDVPVELRARVQDAIRVPLGYTTTQMQWYKNDHHLLRTVQLSFENAWNLPRTSGQLARRAVRGSAMSSLVQTAASMVDVSAGRFLPVQIDSVAVMDELWHPSLSLDERQAATRAFALLPEATQLLVVNIVRAALDATPYIHRAFRHAVYDSLFADNRPLLAAAMAPWIEERNGQYASTDPFGLDALGALDLEALTFAGIIVTSHLDSAVARWQRSPVPPADYEPVLLHTRAGWIVCTGSGDDDVQPTVSPLLAVIDAGGNDTYTGSVASTAERGQFLSIVIDRSGNDTYGTVGDTASVCAAVLGIAVLMDLDGNDTYRCGSVGIVAAAHGIAVLSDQSGNDTYVLQGTYGQAAATAGIAIIDDAAGTDSYTCAAEGQAYAQTRGAALLIDRTGDDVYLARLDGAPSELYLGQTVSRAQGAAFGRRADLGDGTSLAGGVALLVDVEGNDTFTAGAWSQGCGYWWGLGMLEDWSGDDTYVNGKYSLGAGAHYAIGVQVDLQGDDQYNMGNPNVVNQYQGHARDGSIGVSIDGGGNDQYTFRSHCGGSADLCSIGLFWDRSGDDEYVIDYVLMGEANGWADTPPCGTTTRNAPSHTYRDDLPSIGVFFDGVGSDTIVWDGELSTHQSAVRLGFSAQCEDVTAR